MHTTTNQPTTGNNTMNQDVNSPFDTHVEHSTTTRIQSVYDDTNHIIDEMDTTHLPNPSQTTCNVQVMFDFLCGMQDRWILTGSTKQLVEWAQDELIRNGRTDWYFTCIKELVKMYKGGE